MVDCILIPWVDNKILAISTLPKNYISIVIKLQIREAHATKSHITEYSRVPHVTDQHIAELQVLVQVIEHHAREF